MLARAHGTELEILQETDFPHSLGLLYGAVTQFLGFRSDSDEWKVMALASYAETDNEYLVPMRRLAEVHDDGGFSVDLSYLAYYNYWDHRRYGDRFVEAFGPPRTRTEPLTQRHERIASALQKVFEETMAKILTRLHERSGADRLVVSGGCFMNSVFNGKITKVTPFEEVFVTSCPDDSGTSIGAALYLHGLRTGEHRPEAMTHNYWGPDYSDEECRAVVDRFKLAGEAVDDPGKSAAEDLAGGKLVGWFQGPAEFGQRALGGRSILADPRRSDAKGLVNAAVKYRESFRPFAPAILADKVAEWFECEPGAQVPFMERVYQFRPEKRDAVPAVVHVDGSGRLQTVDTHANPRYHRLISRFDELTGVPIVLNTSFNLNGEPIVCAPEDAVRTFYSCGLDVLYLGNIRITK
jgi:carbamoyltransferase